MVDKNNQKDSEPGPVSGSAIARTAKSPQRKSELLPPDTKDHGHGGAASQQHVTARSQLRRLLIFQAKLYVDALRDVLLSPLSAIAFLLDVVQGNDKDNSHFSKVLAWGRRTERVINLFEHQYPDKTDDTTVDDLIRQAEDRVRRQG
jgi:hypothetical protein